MDELSSEEEIKEEEIYRSVTSAVREENEGQVQEDPIIGIQQVEEEKTTVFTKTKDPDQNFRSPRSNIGFGESTNQQVQFSPVIVEEQRNSNDYGSGQEASVRQDEDPIIGNQERRIIEEESKLKESNHPYQERSPQVKTLMKEDQLGIRQPMRHNRAQTTELNPSLKSLQSIIPTENPQITLQKVSTHMPKKPLNLRKLPPQLNNQYVRAQQNNLFKSFKSQQHSIVQDNEAKPIQEDTNKETATVLNQIFGKISTYHKKNQQSSQSISLLKKKNDQNDKQGYDFSSIIYDANMLSNQLRQENKNQNSQLLKQLNISNQFSISENNSILKCFPNQDRSQCLNAQPSFMLLNNEEVLETPIQQIPNTFEDKNRVCFSPTNFIEEIPSINMNANEQQETYIEPQNWQSPEQIGSIVKQAIEEAKVGQVINLPPCHIKITDLHIVRPISIKGRPGTIMEITKGSIVVDFDKDEKFKEVLVICECHIIFSDRANMIVIREELDRDESSLQIDQQDLSEMKDKKQNTPQSKQMLFDTIGSNYNNNERSLREKHASANQGLLSQCDMGNGIFALFKIKSQTFVEIRDCCLESKNKNAVMDAAFVMNEKELAYSTYRGILSVKSCNIQNFSFGFFAGTNSILSIELSYITDCRQTAIFVANPKIFKLSGTVFDNIETDGIEIMFQDSPSKQLLSPSKQQLKDQVAKIFIEENRISGCKKSGILMHTIGSKQTLSSVTNAVVKLQKNRILGNGISGITLKKLNLQQLEILSCDFYCNEVNNIVLIKIKATTPEAFVIQKCRITEALQYGIIARDCQNFTLSECEIVKNKTSGIWIVDTGAEKYKTLTSNKQFQQSIGSNGFNKLSSNAFENAHIMGRGADGLPIVQESLVEQDISPNINNGRIMANQGLSMLLSANRIETSNQLISSQQNVAFYQQHTTQPHTHQGQTFKSQITEKEKSFGGQPQIGMVKIHKCRFIDNKEHGINLETIYQKTVEIVRCKIKDNFLNGICIAQDLDSENEVQAYMQEHGSLSKSNSIRKDQDQMSSSDQQDRKTIFIRKDIVAHSKVLIQNSEILLNKLNGIEMGYTRTTVKDCFIIDNMQCSVKLQGSNTKLLLRIIDTQPTDTMAMTRLTIKGRIGGDWGEILNPQKEIYYKGKEEQSELSRLLAQTDNDDSDSNTEQLKQVESENMNSKSSKSGAFTMKCFSKTEMKKIEKVGEYLIIKEASQKSQRLRQVQSKNSNQKCGFLRTCVTPQHSKVMVDPQIKKKNGCTIF